MFRLSIVTPEKIVYDGDIRSLVAPGADGYFGVLSNHAPMIAALRPGKIEFRDADDKTHLLAVSNGFLEVSNNVATLLGDAVEFAGEIDVQRARAAYERAKSALASFKGGESDLNPVELREAMERAKNRIHVAEDRA